MERIPNTTNPELLYWFIDPKELASEAYSKDIATVTENGTFNFLFLTQRDGADFYDFARMHPIFKDLVRQAHEKGLKVGLQLWPTEDNIPVDQAQGVVVEQEIQLDGDGAATYTAHAIGARTHGDPPEFNAAILSSEFLRAYAFKKVSDGTYAPGSVRDISSMVSVISKDKASISLNILGSRELAGYTVYVLTTHYHHYPDMFSPLMKNSLEDALRRYGDVGFDGAALDEFRYMPLAQNQKFRGRLYSEAMAFYFKRYTGKDLVRSLFDMRYAPEGIPAPRIRAINDYFEILRQGPLDIEKLFAKWTTETMGPAAFHGIHGTFHNALDNDELWATGLNWWAIPREYGQTDENTPMPTRLGIGMAHPRPVEYNQFYSSHGDDFYGEALNDARYNVRVHYHAMNDKRSNRTDLGEPKLLSNIGRVEDKVRLLNQFNAPRPATNILFLFGYPALANWFPDEYARNNWDINGSLKAEEKTAVAWNEGYRGPFAPSYLIDDRKITCDVHGGVTYGGHRYTALVFFGPQYSKQSTLRLLERFVAGGGKLLLDGMASRDFAGNDIARRFQSLANHAVGSFFSLENMALLKAPRLAIPGGALYEDGSIVLTDLTSFITNQPVPFTLSLRGHTFTGNYIGLLAIRTDSVGRLLKLAAGGISQLNHDGQPLVNLNKPADIFLTRSSNGHYHAMVKGDAELIIH